MAPHFRDGYDDVVQLYALPMQLGEPYLGWGARAGPPDPLDERAFAPNKTEVVIDWSGGQHG
jgi:hypothetical protein